MAWAFLELSTRKQICHKMHLRKIELGASVSSLPSNCFGASVSTEHQGRHLHPPGDGPKTKDNHGSRYGQHFARLMTRARSCSTVAVNKAVKQDASVQLPTSHGLPYATVETAMLA